MCLRALNLKKNFVSSLAIKIQNFKYTVPREERRKREDIP